MLQLIPRGPSIPAEVLRAHQNGTLVFFCGAGISVPTGLPAFGGLVESVRNDLGHDDDMMRPPEARALKKRQYDKFLGLLEERYPQMRQKVIDRLSPGATKNPDMHQAILTLSKVAQSAYRIVTTNFDDRFDIASGTSQDPEVDIAPKLNVPKPESWREISYLHGKIGNHDPSGKTLVLTSADFGRAYLAEGWARRFVTQLFREFTVLFIGYSIEDPIMSYLVDALAAEAKSANRYKIAYAFAPYRGNETKRDAEIEMWRAKGIEPIIYNQRNHHLYLTNTLISWARLHAAGLDGYRQRISEANKIRPINELEPDSKLLVWAMINNNGALAHEFSKLDPPAPIDWLLNVFDRKVEIFDDGPNVRLTAYLPTDVSESLRLPENAFSLVAPQHPYDLRVGLSNVTRAIGEWLIHYLNEPRLISWVIKNGYVLHDEFRVIIREGLSKGRPPDLTEDKKRFWELLSSPLFRSVDENSLRYLYQLKLTDPDGPSQIAIDEALDAFDPVWDFKPALDISGFDEIEDDEG